MRPVNTLVKLLLAAGGVDAFFRVTCSPFKRERIDPVVNPGGESKHMHTFFGNRGISPDTTGGDALRGNDACTSCSNQLDRSSYWMPTLYYVKKNVTVPVRVGIFHVYYQGQSEDIKPFPDDYSIVGGDPTLTEQRIRDENINTRVLWYYEESDEVKERWQFPKKRGDGWLRGNVPFPNWVRRDEELGRYRECRDGESDSDGCIVVPSMFFAVWYDVSNHTFFSLEDGDYFTLASGNGETYHGDFINAWDSSVALDVARNTEDFAQIGGSSALELSPKCQDVWDKNDDVIRKADWDAWEMYLNDTLKEDVVTGTYGRDLTITDGKSINATWRGVWGQENSGAEDETPASSGTLVPSGTDLTSETVLPSKTLNTETLTTETAPSSLTVLPSETTSSSEIATTQPSAQSLTTSGGQVVPTTLATSSTINESATTDDNDYDQKETTVDRTAVDIISTSASATETGTAVDGPGCRARQNDAGREHRHHRHHRHRHHS